MQKTSVNASKVSVHLMVVHETVVTSSSTFVSRVDSAICEHSGSFQKEEAS